LPISLQDSFAHHKMKLSGGCCSSIFGDLIHSQSGPL
jgi:hypothetical protein